MSNVPSGFAYIQIESQEFRRPTSEALYQAMGSSINGLLDFRTAQIAQNATFTSEIQSIINYLIPVGTVLPSALSLSQFQSQIAQLLPAGTQWVACDGGSYSGSVYHLVSGTPVVPDTQGLFLRGKDHGAGRNPDGDTPIGTIQSDSFKSHTHTASATTTIDTTGSNVVGSNGTNDVRQGVDKQNVEPGTLNISANTSVTLGSTGSAETRPKNVTMNFYVRIN